MDEDRAALLELRRVLRPGARLVVQVVSADGESVQHASLPDPIVTNICFGGPDLRTAYVTLSATGKLVSFEWPRPGLRLAF